MGVVIRQGIKGSVITYIGAFLGYLTWLRFFPSWLNPDELGLIRALFDATVLLTPFIQGGMNSLVVKFAPYLTTRIENEQRFLGFALVIPLILSSIAVVIFVLFEDWIFEAFNENSPLFAKYLWFLVPLTFFSVYIQLVESLIRIKLRIVVPRIIRELGARVCNLLAAWLYFVGVIDLSDLVLSFIIINSIHLIILAIYYVRLRGAFVKPNLSIVKTRYFKPLLDYSGFMLLGSSGGSLVAKIDSLMTAAIIGLDATGVYGIAFLIATVVELPRRVFTSLLTPLVAVAYRNKDFKLLKNYYHRSAINLSIISVTLFIGIWSNLDLVYSFVPDKDLFETGKWVVFLIGLAKVFDMSMGINAELIKNTKYYRWNIYLTPVLAVLAVITNLLFIPIWGITGAALATFISITLYNIVRFLLIRWKLRLSPFRASNFWVLGLALSTFGITEYIKISNIYLDFLFNGSVVLLGFLLPVWFFRLSPDFNSFVQTTASRFGIAVKR